MKLTGFEVPAETLFKLQPNTVIAVISDDKGEIRTIKINHDSITKDEAFLSVASGCFIRINGHLVWVDPCPH